MTAFKRWLLVRLFTWFGTCSTATRLRIGAVFSGLTLALARSRVNIVRINIALCFPDESPQQRERWARAHIRALSQSFVDRGVLWFGSEQAIEEMVHVEGVERILDLTATNTPVILLAPHFVGLDAAATALTRYVAKGATLYTPQSDPVIDDIVRQGRARFNDTRLISRKDGVRGLIRYLREGYAIYYLPDMDFGRQGSVFVPFFGIAAATLPTTAMIAQKWGARVIPITETWDAATGRYYVKVHPALEDFPGSDSLEQATARQNRLLEDWIRPDPSQYYWVHRRFKTRPPGEAKLY